MTRIGLPTIKRIMKVGFAGDKKAILTSMSFRSTPSIYRNYLALNGPRRFMSRRCFAWRRGLSCWIFTLATSHSPIDHTFVYNLRPMNRDRARSSIDRWQNIQLY
jgi:hypothetical protein